MTISTEQIEQAALHKVYRLARLSRDLRFDGTFFVGVLSTGIYCRPICPAVPAKEANVRYFTDAISAANVGLRPCLRCRPDSAPGSPPWLGTQTSVKRALGLINAGVLSGPQAISVAQLADRLGISSRYLGKLFQASVGTSPKQYGLYQQLMFAKQLLHQTDMAITEVAFASGFKSIRRFNEIFQQQLHLTPSAVRQSGTKRHAMPCGGITLRLHYRPPYDWSHLKHFFSQRAVAEMEWLTDDCYGRSFSLGTVNGYFTATHHPKQACFDVQVFFVNAADLPHLQAVIAQIRRVFDLDADMFTIEQTLGRLGMALPVPRAGIRIPGVWSAFEAACRAILGQQVSVAQAVKLLNQLVATYGESLSIGNKTLRLFPTAAVLAEASLVCLKMPGSRKAALISLARFVRDNPYADIETWLDIKGVGPWTLNYVRLRGLSDPDVLLASDLVVKQQLLANYDSELAGLQLDNLDTKTAKKQKQAFYDNAVAQLTHEVAPWGSYLTFQLWSQQ